MTEAMDSECIRKKYREKCREQRAESREQRAVRGAHRGKKPSCRWWGSTDLYLALNHRERHHKQGSEFGRQVAGDAHQEDIVIISKTD